MANTKTEKKEVGTIGQMYEERKSKKLGVLEERNEKFKTLLMRDKEGSTFNVTYSTFHSSWRKYTGEEVIKTSTQVEESKVEQKQKVEKAEKTLKKAEEKPKLSNEEKVKAVHSASDIVSALVEKSGLDLNVVTSSRGAIMIKTGRKSYVEIWKKFLTDTYDFCVRQDIADRVETDMDLGISKHEDWTLKTMYSVSSKSFEKVTGLLLIAIESYIKDNKEEK